MEKVDFIELIAEDVMSLAKKRADQSSDLVAALHGVLMELGLVVGRKLDEIQMSERQGEEE